VEFSSDSAASRLGERVMGAVAARVNGQVVDLSAQVSAADEVEPVDARGGVDIIRHSSAHVLAKAVSRLYPGAQLGYGPATNDGFYYDFGLPEGGRFEEEDLAVIEAEMRRIIAADEAFERVELDAEAAWELFRDQRYKRETIERVLSDAGDEGDLADVGQEEGLSAYRTGEDFVDLCKGPHVPSTGVLGAFKLVRVSGAYWRGDETRDQLQRVAGLCFGTQEELTSYQALLVEAEARDHRRIGAELDMFHFPPEIGGGLPVFHPRGAFVRYRMEDFSRRSHLKAGYSFAWTPHIAKSTLFEISGHLSWYKDDMYPPMEMDGGEYYPKPMNCPMHILIYRSRQRSYRELPLRLFEFGTVYRYERSGTLHGLARVRGLTQDDAHIFCAPDQLAAELTVLLRFVLDLLGAFGLTEFEAELSTRPEKAVGSLEDWEIATAALEEALVASGLSYKISPGEGAFYAPKIDIHLTDAIGRRWQLSTLQVDLNLPQLFDLEFTDSDNTHKRPWMIHRALFGSVERFLAILIEHYAGALPAWLEPEQVRVLPVAAEAEDYAREVTDDLLARGYGAKVMAAQEPLGARIRRTRLEHIPVFVVVGMRDVEAGTVAMTVVSQGGKAETCTRQEFLARMDDVLGEPELIGGH